MDVQRPIFGEESLSDCWFNSRSSFSQAWSIWSTTSRKQVCVSQAKLSAWIAMQGHCLTADRLTGRGWPTLSAHWATTTATLKLLFTCSPTAPTVICFGILPLYLGPSDARVQLRSRWENVYAWAQSSKLKEKWNAITILVWWTINLGKSPKQTFNL